MFVCLPFCFQKPFPRTNNKLYHNKELFSTILYQETVILACLERNNMKQKSVPYEAKTFKSIKQPSLRGDVVMQCQIHPAMFHCYSGAFACFI